MLTRKQGHVVGMGSLVASAACAARCVAFGVSGSAIAVGLTAVGLGYHLLTKLYMNDPEAVAEYRREVDAMTLPVAFRKYSPEQVTQMFGLHYVRGRIASETGMASLARLCDAFGISVVHQLIKLDIVTRDEASEMAGRDTDSVQSFSALWRRFDDELPAVWRLGVFPSTSAVRQLLMQEFDWVDDGGSPRAATAPPTSVTSTMPAFKAAVTFGAWTCQHLNVSHSFWQGALKTSPEGASSALSELIRLGLKSLHRQQLIDAAWVQHKFDTELKRRQWTLWAADDAVDLRDCVLNGLVRPEQIERIFAAAIPTERGSATSHAKEAHIIEFLRYFEPVLRRHSSLIPAFMQGPVLEAKRYFESAEAAYVRDCDRARDREREAVRRWEKEHPAPPRGDDGCAKDHKDALARKRKCERERRDSAERDASSRLALEMTRIHEDFALAVHDGGRMAPMGLSAECRLQ